MGRLQGESAVVLLVCRTPPSICCAKQRGISFTHVLEGDKPVHLFPRFSPHIFSGQSVIVVSREGHSGGEPW